MIGGIALLLACELAGETLRSLAHLAVPGPVLGMLLLTGLLLARQRRADEAGSAPEAGGDSGLERVAGGLISNMGLLFVPAGVGVIAQFALIRAQWLPILAGLFGSTLLGLLATALVMRWFLAAADASSDLPGETSR